jgi:hypothetical protein
MFSYFLKSVRKKCPECTKKIRYKNIMNKYDDVKNNIESIDGYKLLSTEYNGYREKLTIECPEHHIFKMSYKNFFYEGCRCMICNNILVTNTESFKNEIKKRAGDEFTVLGEYKNNVTKIAIRHNTCGNEFYAKPMNFLISFNCPFCSESRGEKFIEFYLKKHFINYKRQYRIKECKNKKQLPFDFAIFDNMNNLIMLIEYDGQQHFKPTNFKGVDNEKAKVNFDKTKINDNIKNNYCRKNNIKLLRIPYTDIEKIDYILDYNLEVHHELCV